jgi:predicted O-methyltransferase YrrM
MKQLKTKLAKWLKTRNVYKNHKLKLLRSLKIRGLPEKVIPAVEWMLLQKPDPALALTMASIEQRRTDIAASNGVVDIWYSPRPGSAGADPLKVFKPLPGDVKQFSMYQIAHTGKDRISAAMLHLLAKHHRSEFIFELGSCAGLSAAYLASVDTLQQLWTVEGAPNLAAIAKQTLVPWQKTANVYTGHFDDAIDELSAKHAGQWDFIYIDGHHEKIATIHYFNRMLPALRPGAMVVFDDISWSQDMREAWDLVRTREEFSDAIDFGSIGVCLLKSELNQQSPAKQWNLQPILGRHKIGKPAGWNNN